MGIHNITTDAGGDGAHSFGNDILKILLIDRTTKRNITWATSDYAYYGKEYQAECPITVDRITGDYSHIIQPRITKAKTDQAIRTKEKAEVFTPAWICNEQNNLVDASWFGRADVFNFSRNKGWRVNEAVIPFEDRRGRRWTDYVDARQLEITCGEAPYLTSRYDMLTGSFIDVGERIGLLDRKLRVVNENTDTEEEWLKWAYRSYESIYGFEFQGDSLLIARENLLYTFIENMQYRFHRSPTPKELKRAARIISWNVWQMDGRTFTVPFGKLEETEGTSASKDEKIYCKVHDWRSKVTMLYQSLLEK